MRVKYKILLILFVLTIIVLGSGITYSIFTSRAQTSLASQDIAKFVFDARLLDSIEVPLTSIKPGDTKEYEFSVSNNSLINNATAVSNVTLEYQINISTYHFMPLSIRLIKMDGTMQDLECTEESYSRNEENKLICNTPTQTMAYDVMDNDAYKLIITFPSRYNTEAYTNLVDYIDLEISSWQKVEG